MLFDVDGTLIDALANQRQVWRAWAGHYDLDPDQVYATALRTRPQDTFTAVAPGEDPDQCLARLHALEDEDARSGTYDAFAGASDLLTALPPRRWALVTSNYAHRVAIRFHRCGLPLPEVVIDAPAAAHGKPHPAPYLLAAQRLGVAPSDCLVIEDTASGAAAGLAAGMTVWTVNAAEPVPGAHRHYANLQAAAADILDHLS
ncbi:sugar-phosphatase [Kineococcus xinjiangensis]|uniref:Sugar-phosphatase n=1 Tax=Kineococcus xinjiangensis TaxID=512762 RepID=A0A2S6IEQ2_9ACTN|nr:sugar-phosphatase [Kineococcus xinjiangensis]